MVKHNNIVPNIHLRKDWQRYIKTHFDQPSKAKTRRKNRLKKQASRAPRPLRKLRPIVNCPTQKYNMKIRAGKGFSLLELKRANLNPRYARTIGIKVDVRRRNKSNEGLVRNVNRLKSYLKSLVLFPVEPTNDESNNEEKMISYYESIAKAENKVSSYLNYNNEPFKVKNEKNIVSIVNLKDVPNYDAFGTARNEWCLSKRYFKFRKRAKYMAYKKKKDEKKAAKKAAKGGGKKKDKKKK